MERSEDTDIVIVGGGICGLATALALHRKGIRCLVLERSEKLRGRGAAIIVQTNGWRALHHLGVASSLRPTALQIHGGKFMPLEENEAKEIPFRVSEEVRCLKRIDLLEVMADNLPVGTIRTGSHVLSIQLDSVTKCPHLLLSNGSVLQAKVVVGCDGVNSVIANMVGIETTKCLATCVARGLTNYANGHKFASEFFVITRNEVQLGRIPITRHLVYWFITRLWTSQDSMISKNSVLIRQSLMESMKGFPAHAMEMIEKCDLNSLHLTDLKYRPPWVLLLNKFRKGTVTVAGDAMHASGPFIAQGGSASIEDALVLARCLAQNIIINTNNNDDGNNNNKKKKVVVDMVAVELALDQYVKERRMRIFWLSLQSYLIGKKLDFTQSLIRKFIVVLILVVLFRDPDGHTYYDCGTL